MAAISSSVGLSTDDDVEIEDPQDLADLVLELHNDFRRDHDAPDMSLDLNLCQQAESYAMCLLNGEKPQSSVCAGLGKNIYKIQHSESDPYYLVSRLGEAVREAVNAWYNYQKDYHWSDPVSSSATAKSFSQLVWKSSSKLGVGVVSRGEPGIDLLIVVMTLYSPPGNVVSNESYTANVRPRNICRAP